MKNISLRHLSIVPILMLSSTVTFGNASIEATQLLGYFSAGCASQGQWTLAAQGYANNLVNTLTSLASDPDCKTLNGALTQVKSLSSSISALSQDQNQRKYASLKKQEQELFLIISQTTDTGQLGT